MRIKRAIFQRTLMLIATAGFLLSTSFIAFNNALNGTADAAAAPLYWSPPRLEDPIVINLGTGATSNNLNPNRDYIIRFPGSKRTGYTWLSGGRNIVILGGHITTPTGYTNTSERRALYIKEATGTVHIEGLLIDSSGGGEHDAITINAPSAVVQVQNILVENLKGSFNSEHADMIQPWGGVRELRVDRFTGSTNYQGFYLVQTQSAEIGPVWIRNTNLIHQASPVQNVPAMIYLDDRCNWHPTSVSFTNVYIQPHSSRPFQYVVEPATDNPTCGSVLSNNALSWPKTGWISGKVQMGLPPQGDYVLRQSVGLNYVSPGYIANTSSPSPPQSSAPTSPSKPETNGSWSYASVASLPSGDYAYSARLISGDGDYGESVGPVEFSVQLDSGASAPHAEKEGALATSTTVVIAVVAFVAAILVRRMRVGWKKS